MSGAARSTKPALRRVRAQLRANVPVVVEVAMFAMLRVALAATAELRVWGDTAAYIGVSRQPLLSEDFLAGHRAPGAPFVLKLLGENLRSYTIAQTVFGVMAWALLAVVVGGLVPAGWRRAVAAGAVLVFALAHPIAEWDRVALTESFALSWLAVTLATALLFVRRPNVARGFAFVCACTALVFTRDTFIVPVALGALVLLAAGALPAGRRSFVPRGRALVATGLAVLAVAIGAQLLAQRSDRQVVPIWQALTLRVFPYPERLAWFAEHGMPQAETIATVARQTGPEDHFPRMTPDLGDKRWAPLFAWLRRDAASTYSRYLVTHPWYTLTEPLRRPQRVFNNHRGDVDFYGPPDDTTLPLTGLALPGWPFVVVMGGVAVLVLGRRRFFSRPEVGVGAALVGFALPHALIAWHGDGMEAARHVFTASVQARLGVVVLLVVAALGSRPRSEPSSGVALAREQASDVGLDLESGPSGQVRSPSYGFS